MSSHMYNHINRRAIFSAPQFNRTRHRYRGPRETQKINLEIGQMTFSIYKLYDQFNDLDDEIDVHREQLFEGGELEGVLDEVNLPVHVDGLYDLSQRITQLRDRIKVLEAS